MTNIKEGEEHNDTNILFNEYSRRSIHLVGWLVGWFDGLCSLVPRQVLAGTGWAIWPGMVVWRYRCQYGIWAAWGMAVQPGKARARGNISRLSRGPRFARALLPHKFSIKWKTYIGLLRRPTRTRYREIGISIRCHGNPSFTSARTHSRKNVLLWW